MVTGELGGQKQCSGQKMAQGHCQPYSCRLEGPHSYAYTVELISNAFAMI
jgi:hypothetical protein